MRTRASIALGLASPPPSSPPPPSKDETEISATTAEPAGQHDRSAPTGTSSSALRNSQDDTHLTPHRPSKRVRFSDPGPHGASSGLTPQLRRSTLSPTSTHIQAPDGRGHKRKSSHSSLQTPESSPLPDIEIQTFTPLKQSLDERTKRRLKRSHLSEESNEWEQEHRAEVKARQALIQLRDDHAKKADQIKSLTLEVELQRQLGLGFNVQEEENLENLRQELAEVREKLAQYEDRPPAKPSSETDIDLPLLEEGFHGNWDEESWPSSLSPRPQQFNTASSPLQSIVNELREQGNQASLPNPEYEAQVKTLEADMERFTREGTDALAAVGILRDELRGLGFGAAEAEDADEITAVIREAFRVARLELERILPGETQCGLDDGKLLLESMLRHLSNLQQKSLASEKAAESHRQAESALRRQFIAALGKLAELEQSCAEIMEHRTRLISDSETNQQDIDALRDELQTCGTQLSTDATRIADLEASQRESEVTVERLQHALKSYQGEVESLESLVAKLEQEKEGAVALLGTTKRESETRLLELERRSKETTATYERRLAELDQDLIRAEEEVAVDREKLLREKGAFEERIREMAGRCNELQEKRQGDQEVVEVLRKSNTELKAELDDVRNRFATHGQQVKSIFDEACSKHQECWRVEEEYLRLVK